MQHEGEKDSVIVGKPSDETWQLVLLLVMRQILPRINAEALDQTIDQTARDAHQPPSP